MYIIPFSLLQILWKDKKWGERQVYVPCNKDDLPNFFIRYNQMAESEVPPARIFKINLIQMLLERSASVKAKDTNAIDAYENLK
jgi:hypothetical protein